MKTTILLTAAVLLSVTPVSAKCLSEGEFTKYRGTITGTKFEMEFGDAKKVVTVYGRSKPDEFLAVVRTGKCMIDIRLVNRDELWSRYSIEDESWMEEGE